MSQNENEISPLDQVRMAEAEVTRSLVAARESAEQTVAKARAQAALRKNEARETGRHEGEAIYKNIIAKADEEAQVIVSQSHHRAAELRQQGHQQMEKAVSIAIRIVLGMEREDTGT